MFLKNRNIRNSLVFSFIAALCWVIAEAGRDLGTGDAQKILFAWVVFNFLPCFALSLINLTPAIIVRFIRISAADEPFEEGSGAAAASLIHYATIYLFIYIPYKALTGAYPLSRPSMLMGIAGYIAWAVVSYIAAYSILTMPPMAKTSMEEIDIPLNDSDKCLMALGHFMTLMASSAGERRKIDKLWKTVSDYLKDNMRIQKLVLNNGLRHDEIALNAVGSVAFKLLSEGDFHVAFGTLSPDGEYVRKVWWITANELAKRSYCRPEDVTQGIQSLDAIIVSVNPKQ